MKLETPSSCGTSSNTTITGRRVPNSVASGGTDADLAYKRISAMIVESVVASPYLLGNHQLLRSTFRQ